MALGQDEQERREGRQDRGGECGDVEGPELRRGLSEDFMEMSETYHDDRVGRRFYCSRITARMYPSLTATIAAAATGLVREMTLMTEPNLCQKSTIGRSVRGP